MKIFPRTILKAIELQQKKNIFIIDQKNPCQYHWHTTNYVLYLQDL